MNATVRDLRKTSASHARWLVVDDEPSVLRVMAQVLSTVPGADVVACDSPRAALEVFFAEPESFELLVTDFNMPGLDGIALAEAVHARAPHLKVLMLTGSDLDDASARPGELQALLPKPCAPAALLAAVRSVLAPRWEASRCGASACGASQFTSPVAARPEPPQETCLG